MTLPSFLTGKLWKIGAALATVVSVILIALLIAANFENRDLMKQRNQAIAAINDPETGYVARLSQSRTNVATLTAAIDAQRIQFQQEAVKNNTRLRETEQKLAAAQAKTASMQKNLNSFLATKPQGVTLEERIRDIDQRGLSEMVQ